jgi:hypothetical protein
MPRDRNRAPTPPSCQCTRGPPRRHGRDRPVGTADPDRCRGKGQRQGKDQGKDQGQGQGQGTGDRQEGGEASLVERKRPRHNNTG